MAEDVLFSGNRLVTEGGRYLSEILDDEDLIPADPATFTEIDDLADVNAPAPADNEVLTWDAGAQEWVAAAPPGAEGGEANTVTNVGTGAEIAKTKVGVDIPVRSVVGGTGITVTENADDVTIDRDAIALADLSDVVGGGTTGDRLVQQGDGSWAPEAPTVTNLDDLGDVNAPTPSADDVLTWDDSAGEWIPAAAPGAGAGEANTISSVGTGASFVKGKVGVDLRLKSLTAGANVTLTENTDDVEIELAGDLALDASALGYLDAVTAGIVFDAHRNTDGAITASDATLTSTTGGFETTDVGKAINLTIQRFLVVTASSGNTTLTSSGGFVAADVGRTIDISAAKTSGFTFSTTIASFTDANTVTLTAAPNISITRDACIHARHHTTIASRTSSTEVELTAAPTWGGTGITVVWGTDNYTTFHSAIASTVSTKPLYCPPGKFLVVISDSLTPTQRSGDFTMIGASQDTTEMLVASAARPTVTASSTKHRVFRFKAGHVHLKDMTFRYVGFTGGHDSDATSLLPPLLDHEMNHVSGSNTDELINSARFTRTKVLNFSHALTVSGGSTNPSRAWVDDSEFEVQIHTISYFRGQSDTRNNHELVVRNSSLRNTFVLTTSGADAAHNNHLTYIHGAVSRCFVNVACHIDQGTTSSGQTTDADQLRSYGGSSTIYPKKPDYFERTIHTGGGVGIYTNNSGTGKQYLTATIIGSRFECKQGLEIYAPVTVSGCYFKTVGNAAVKQSSATTAAADCSYTFTGCHFDAGSYTGGGYVMPGHGNTVWEFNGCTFMGRTADVAGAAVIGSEGTLDRIIRFNDCRFRGQGADRVLNAYGAGATLGGNTTTFSRCWFLGTWTNIVRSQASGIAADADSLTFDECRFMQVGDVLPSTGLNNHGNVRGQGNFWGSETVYPVANTSTGSASFVPPARRSGTALTVTSNKITPSWNYQTFDVTGAATINDIRAGEDSVGVNRCRGGDLYLVAVTGDVTFAHNAGGTGNIRCPNATNIVLAVGEMIHLRADPRNGLWYVVGSTA